jgi:GNAT superfamily N-acetyltransferase
MRLLSAAPAAKYRPMPAPEYRCRKAAQPDQPVITRFQLEMALETERLRLDAATCARGVQAVLDDPGKGAYFVCERAGRVIASLLIVPEWSDWRCGHVWWIHSVYVIPEERGTGAFRRLYEHVRSLVQAEESLRGLRLYVDKTNVSAQNVYRKLGMTDEHYALFEWMKTF